MKKNEMESLLPGDLLFVNGSTYEGLGVVTLSSGRIDPNHKGELSYAFRCGEPFPQIVINTKNNGLIHYNGDDFKKLKKGGKVEESDQRWNEAKSSMSLLGVGITYGSSRHSTRLF